MIRIAGIILLLLAATAPALAQANWWLKDIENPEANYRPLTVDGLRVGQSRADIETLLGRSLDRVASSSSGETYMVEQWVAVQGPDYVENRLYLKFVRGTLAAWQIERAGWRGAPARPPAW
jgi:hypothetical protein